VERVSDDVYLYGSGTFAADLYSILDQAGIHVASVIELEGLRIGQTFPCGGHVVENASDALAARPLPVLLAIHNPYADIRAIASRLEALGAPTVLSPLQLYRELRSRGVDAPTRYWLAGTSDMDPLTADAEPRELAALRSRLEDAKSVECLDALIAWRRSGDWRDAPVPRSMEEQYCSADVPLPRERISFVDVGAFTGDTICNMVKRGFTFERVLALEPDPMNFPDLVKTVKRTGIAVSALAIGAGSETDVLCFSASGTSASVFDAAGDTYVQVQRLDDLLIGQRADYVKMDIEGGELEAIRGLAGTISDQAPALAISVYHKPTDLTAIPAYLMELKPDYRFYLRTYAQSSFETVLYAVLPS
jgi:FkbM family methyltransferase